MNDKQRVNEMVTEYQRNGSGEIFSELYAIIQANHFGKENAVARRWQLDVWDVTAMQDDALLKAVETYDEAQGNFENHLNAILSNRRIDLGRKRQTRVKHEALVSPAEGEDEASTFDRLNARYNAEAATDAGIPDEIIATKKEEDQRQLISLLLENADRSTAVIAEAILADDSLKKSFKATAIAERCGVHHSRIKRKLRNLAKNYEASKHGDYHDYLGA